MPAFAHVAALPPTRSLDGRFPLLLEVGGGAVESVYPYLLPIFPVVADTRPRVVTAISSRARESGLRGRWEAKTGTRPEESRVALGVGRFVMLCDWERSRPLLELWMVSCTHSAATLRGGCRHWSTATPKTRSTLRLPPVSTDIGRRHGARGRIRSPCRHAGSRVGESRVHSRSQKSAASIGH